MRVVFEELANLNKNIEFLSLCIHHDYSDNSQDVGFKAYYENDSYTSQKFVENSKTSCETIDKYCRNVYYVNKNEGTEISNHIIEEDWAMANLGEIGKDEKYKNVNAGATVLFLGYMSNPAQLEKLKKPSLQNDFAKQIEMSLREIFFINYR